MKISGTVKNATTNKPISGAKVELSVADTELAVLYTNENGEFETSQSGDYIGRTLVCNVGKTEFEDAEVKQSIEEEEIKFKIELIPVYVPPKMIPINGSVVDANSKSPIDGAELTFKVGKEEIDQQKTGTDGLFSFEINESNIGKKLEYKIKKEGYQPLKGKIEVEADMGSIDLQLTTGIDIPVWLGLRSKRNFFFKGYISFFVVLSIITLTIPSYDIFKLMYLFLIPIYILVTSLIIKGYLVPVVSNLLVLNYLLLWNWKSMYIIEYRIEGILIILILGSHSAVSLISTYFARRIALKQGKVDDSTISKHWSENIFSSLTKSPKQLLIILGAAILIIIILLLIVFN